MRTRQFKVNTAQGISQVEDFVDTEGACVIALELFISGVRNPALCAFVEWLTNLGRMPTDAEFIAFVPTIGAQLITVNADNIDN